MPISYVEMLVKARAQSIVAYGQSHVGLFNYPTKVGQQHRGLKGRNILGEVIERCHAHEIAVVIYTSLIFDRWAADNHPEWRMVTHDGKPQGEGGPARRAMPQLALSRVRARVRRRDLPELRLRGHALRHDVLAVALFLPALPEAVCRRSGRRDSAHDQLAR